MFTPRWSGRRRSAVRRAVGTVSVLGATIVLPVLLFSNGSASAEPSCQTTRTTIVYNDVSYDVPLTSCIDLAIETSTQTVVTTSTSSVADVSTETELATTTEITSVPTTVEIPTTVPVPVTETATVTEPGGTVGGTVTEQATVTERATETERETDTETTAVEVTWGYASTVNPATGKIPAVSLSASEVSPGDSLTVFVSGFSAGELVRIEFHSEPVTLGEVTAGPDGSAQIVVTIPRDAQLGQHAIRVVGLSCGIDSAVPLTVVSGPPGGATYYPTSSVPLTLDSNGSAAGSLDGGGSGTPGGTGTLSYTGVNAGQSIVVAAILIAGGAGVVFLARRTRRSKSEIHRG